MIDVTYIKRYRMEIDVSGDLGRPAAPPPGYRFVAWEPNLLEAFAEAKYLSFRDEIDANVFPCLGEREGCRRLMQEIVRKPGFMREATWLLVFEPRGGQPASCGTVQGIRDFAGLGAIQNLGITPQHRDLGLGSRLLFQALQGFRLCGVRRVYLEVTAQNEGAVRLYHRLGFVTVKTLYKAVEPVYS